MVTVGQEYRPAVRLLSLDEQGRIQRGRAGAIGVHAPHSALGGGSVHNYVLRAPRPPTAFMGDRDDLRRSAGDGNLHEFGFGEEGDVAVVGRPEGITRTLRARKFRGSRITDALHK